MRTHKELFTAISIPLLSFLENLPLQNQTIDTSYWNKRVSKMFECLVNLEIIPRDKVRESIKNCIRNNARKSREELKNGKPLNDIQSPEALAYAIQYLDYSPRITFSDVNMSEEAFLRTYISELEKKVKDQLYFTETLPLEYFC